MPVADDSQFKELREDIRQGFKDVNSRIDTLVTRNEFSAELRRIDEKHQSHVDATNATFENQNKELEKIVIGNRWGIGIAVAGAGVVVAVINFITGVVSP